MKDKTTKTTNDTRPPKTSSDTKKTSSKNCKNKNTDLYTDNNRFQSGGQGTVGYEQDR